MTQAVTDSLSDYTLNSLIHKLSTLPNRYQINQILKIKSYFEDSLLEFKKNQ